MANVYGARQDNPKEWCPLEVGVVVEEAPRHGWVQQAVREWQGRGDGAGVDDDQVGGWGSVVTGEAVGGWRQGTTPSSRRARRADVGGTYVVEASGPVRVVAWVVGPVVAGAPAASLGWKGDVDEEGVPGSSCGPRCGKSISTHRVVVVVASQVRQVVGLGGPT